MRFVVCYRQSARRERARARDDTRRRGIHGAAQPLVEGKEMSRRIALASLLAQGRPGRQRHEVKYVVV